LFTENRDVKRTLKGGKCNGNWNINTKFRNADVNYEAEVSGIKIDIIIENLSNN
jgi:hypothetical protein